LLTTNGQKGLTLLTRRPPHARFSFLPVVVAAPLGARANLQTAANDSDCRHLLSPEGEPRRFCQTGNRITVDDKTLDTEQSANARLIDNPEFLAALMANLPNSTASTQRRVLGAPACKKAAPSYITIAASDFAAPIHARTYVVEPGAGASNAMIPPADTTSPDR